MEDDKIVLKFFYKLSLGVIEMRNLLEKVTNVEFISKFYHSLSSKLDA